MFHLVPTGKEKEKAFIEFCNYLVAKNESKAQNRNLIHTVLVMLLYYMSGKSIRKLYCQLNNPQH